MSLTNEDIFEFEAEPVRRLPRSSEASEFFRKKQEENALRDKEPLHQGSSRPPTLLMPVYEAYLTANVWMRPRPRPGGCDMLFLAILEPMRREGYEAVYRRFDHDRLMRKNSPKDSSPWRPHQVRGQKTGEERTTLLYRTEWDFSNPMKSLEDLFRANERPNELDRKLKQLEDGVYVHVATSSTPRRALSPR